MDDYDKLTSGVEFPHKYRRRYPLWHHESHLLANAKGEDITKHAANIIRIMKNTIGVEDNL